MMALLLTLFALCPEPAPEPVAFVDARIVGFLPQGYHAELILAVGVDSGIAIGDRGFVACAPNEVVVREVWPHRAKARMTLDGAPPPLTKVRVMLRGQAPVRWCPPPP